MKGSVSFVALCAVAMVVVVMAVLPPAAEAVTCSPTELTPCASAISSGSPPSAACCSKLREQKPCFCGYLRNPALQPYINNPNAKKVASACGVTYPKC